MPARKPKPSTPTIDPKCVDEAPVAESLKSSELHLKLIQSLDEALKSVEALRLERVQLKCSTSRLQSLHRELQELRKVAERYCK